MFLSSQLQTPWKLCFCLHNCKRRKNCVFFWSKLYCKSLKLPENCVFEPQLSLLLDKCVNALQKNELEFYKCLNVLLNDLKTAIKTQKMYCKCIVFTCKCGRNWGKTVIIQNTADTYPPLFVLSNFTLATALLQILELKWCFVMK